MILLFKVAEAIDWLVIWVGRIAAWAGVVLVGVTVYDVFTRYLLDLGSTRLQDFEWWLHTALFSFCLGYAYLKDAHVRIDLIRDNLSRRTKHALELIGCLLALLPYSLLVLYFSSDYAWRSFVIDEGSKSATGLDHVWIVKFAIPAGFILLFLAGICVLLRKVVDLFGPEELRRRAEAEELAEREPLVETHR